MEQEKAQLIKNHWSIDMVNVVGNLRRMPVAFILNNGEWICRRENYMWQYIRKFENGDTEVLITVQRLKFHKHFDDPVWVQYNPNHLENDDLKQLERIMYSIDHTHLTRVDLACDIYNVDLSLYDFGLFNVTRDIYRTLSGKLETRYWGRRKSERQIRLYDKANERKKHGKKDEIPDWAEEWWRLEFQFRQGKVDSWQEEIIEKMSSFHVLAVDDNDNLTETEKAILERVNADKYNFKKVGKENAAKIRKMVRENVGFDTTVSDLAILDFNEQQEIIQKQLKSLMTKYYIKPQTEELTRYFEDAINSEQGITVEVDTDDIVFKNAMRNVAKSISSK